MRHLPAACRPCWRWSRRSSAWAEDFAGKENALFLGRGLHYPIALEGALKLKEISYIHAEAYPAGELKHGPLALVTSEMPVVTVAPNDALLEKLKSNMQEVRARGGVLYVFADADTQHRKRRRRARDPHARALRRAVTPSCTWCRCSCWRTTRPVRAAPMWTSRATWPRA
jgi:glucosamine 6-phosphate synthetase-like amidotransferase/phosphosugar isomerase protein